MAERYDDELDKEALLQQLGGQQGPDFSVKAPEVRAETGAPTSNTMPIAPEAAPAAVTPAARTPTQASVFQGFTPRHAMEGFAFDREQNTGRSAKDAFAYLANQAPPPPLNDRAALEAWTNQYIVPGMNDLGHNVSNVQGDKFHLNNWQGDFDVDYGRGAGADGGALAWQVDDGTSQQSAGAYTPQQQTSLAIPTDTGPSAQDEIMAELEALINGGNSQMDERALMELLGGQP